MSKEAAIRKRYHIVMDEMDAIGILQSNEDKTSYTLSHKTVEYLKSLERKATLKDIVHLVWDVYKIRDDGAIIEYCNVIYHTIQIFERKTNNVGVLVEELKDV